MRVALSRTLPAVLMEIEVSKRGRLVRWLESVGEAHYAFRTARGSMLRPTTKKQIAALLCALIAAAPAANAAEYRIYHPDMLGSNTLVTNRQGEVVQRTVHRPYGEIAAMVDDNGSSIAPQDTRVQHLFTGQEYDSESHLSYYGARYYDPAVGRFLATDPALRGAFGNASFHAVTYEPGNLNGHAYVGNRPTTHVDPSGRIAVPILAGLFGISVITAKLVGDYLVEQYKNGFRGPSIASPRGPTNHRATRHGEPGPVIVGQNGVEGTAVELRPEFDLVDADGNPIDDPRAPDAHIEFDAKDAPIAYPDLDGDLGERNNTDTRGVVILPDGGVGVVEGRHRAEDAKRGTQIDPKIGGVAGKPGRLRYPIVEADGSQDILIDKAEYDELFMPRDWPDEFD